MPSKRPVAEQYDRMFADAGEELVGFLGREVRGGQLQQVPVGALDPNPHQPRQSFPAAAIGELAASIKEQGLLQPLIVRPKGDERFEIVAGERRWRAAQQAGLEEVPCLVQELSDSDARSVALIENLHREDLNDLERGRALHGLKDVLLISWADVAKRVALSKRSVLRLAGLVDLPEQIQDMFGTGKLTEKHGRALRKLGDDSERQMEMAMAIKEQKLSGDETVAVVKLLQEHPHTPAQRAAEEYRELWRRRAGTGAIIKSVVSLIQVLRTTDVRQMDETARHETNEILQTLDAVTRNYRAKLGGG